MCCVIKILSAIVFGVIAIWLFIWWCGFNYGGEVKLRLKTFRQIFLVDPKRWYYRSEYGEDFNHLHYKKRYGDSPRVKLSFLAFLWFLAYHVTTNYRNKKQAERDCLIGILETCQKDIDRIKQESEGQIEQALKDQERILKNWR